MRESILISDSTRFVSFSTSSKKVACLLASATSGLAHLRSYTFVRRRGGEREREKKRRGGKGPVEREKGMERKREREREREFVSKCVYEYYTYRE